MKTKKQKREEILSKFEKEFETLKKMHEESLEANKRNGFIYFVPKPSRLMYVESQIESLKRNLGQ
ncbi:MAG: hypothetical protein WA061_02095 [Microgenomates group bacterium]